MSAAETVQFVGITGPIALSGTTTGTVNLYGVSSMLTDTTTAATVTDRTVSNFNIWEELLTGLNHNTATSAGKRLRDLASAVIITGVSPNTGGTANTTIRIELDSNASGINGAYDPAVITIVGGTGAGQSRQIFEYDGNNKYAYVNRDWKTIPDNTSEYVITANSGDTHVNEGVAQGGSNNTITLNSLASSDNDAYVGQIIFLTAGTGADQSRRVISYDGATKIATVDRNWITNPAAGTIYTALPTSLPELDNLDTTVSSRSSHTAANVWTSGTRTLTSFGTLVADTAASVWTYITRTLTSGSSATIENQTDMIDKLKGIMSKDHSLSTAVNSYDPSTDSNEAIRERGDSAWLTGGGAGGASTVTITVQDQDSAAIPDCSVQIWNTGLDTLISFADTDSNGQVSLSADDGSYKVKLRKAGFSFNATEDLTVSGTTTATYSGTSTIPDAPVSVESCRVYDYAFQGDGSTPVESLIAKARIMSLPEDANSILHTGKEIDAVYDSSTGLFYWDLVKGAEVEFRIIDFGKYIKTVPTTSTAQLSDI
jgi:hypothetical protein